MSCAFDFVGRVAVVAGAGVGIGRAVAEAFAAAGAAVVLLDVDDDAGAAALARVEEILGTARTTARAPDSAAAAGALFVHADVSSGEDVAAAIARTEERFGRLDIVVSNAGIQPRESYVDPVHLPDEVFDRILAVNLRSRFLLAKHAVPLMRKGGHGGAIIHIASVQGVASMPGVAAYAASKGGDLALVRALAVEYAREKIRVLAVNPGSIDTPLLRAALGSDDPEAKLERLGRLHPIGRPGTPAEVASVVLFLASDAASFMTGSAVFVDGGIMALGAWGIS